MLVPNDTPLLRLRQLDFLAKHSFIAATCRLDAVATTLFVRIYLIPWDLPGVHGKLRVRDEVSVVAPARRHLRSLLTEIVQDDDAWDALSSPHGPPLAKQFFGNESVGSPSRSNAVQLICRGLQHTRTMAEIYNELRSPIPSAKFVVNDIPGMKSALYPYQKVTVATMLAWELEPSSVTDPLYMPVTGIDGSVFYLQPETFELLQ